MPGANLLYSPRNKILATSMLIEAFLYEEQTRRGVSLQHWDAFGDVADHCTVCHKCESPCPVDIDFGDVSMAMRDVLRRLGNQPANPAKSAAMFFLNTNDPGTVRLTRKLMIDWGYKAQRLGHRTLGKLGAAQARRPPATTGGRPPLREQVIHFVNKKMPGNLPKKTARALLDVEDRNYVPIIRDPARSSADAEAVFYFPGCGSERLFSQVGLATQAMLWHAGVQTVLPPGYLCCGYPQRGSGQFDQAEKIITDNRVLFHRVANTLNYLDIRTVVVSCGTCHDQLQGYEFDKIFPGSRILDIHEFLLEKGIRLEGATGVRYMYHDPCHSPMKTHDPLTVVNALMNADANGRIEKNDRCCGESGTFAVARPDIATQVRFRKQREMEAGAARLRADGFRGEVKVLTSCPSCLQGLPLATGALSIGRVGPVRAASGEGMLAACGRSARDRVATRSHLARGATARAARTGASTYSTGGTADRLSTRRPPASARHSAPRLAASAGSPANPRGSGRPAAVRPACAGRSSARNAAAGNARAGDVFPPGTRYASRTARSRCAACAGLNRRSSSPVACLCQSNNNATAGGSQRGSSPPRGEQQIVCRARPPQPRLPPPAPKRNPLVNIPRQAGQPLGLVHKPDGFGGRRHRAVRGPGRVAQKRLHRNRQQRDPNAAHRSTPAGRAAAPAAGRAGGG